MNITVPATATSGDNAIEIIGPDSDNFQATIPVGTASASASDRPAVSPDSVVRRVRARRVNPNFAPHALPCFIPSGRCGV
jgi:hypothetical protein